MLGRAASQSVERARALQPRRDNRAIDLDATDAPAWFNRGIVYDDLGDRDHAIMDYSRAIGSLYGRGFAKRKKGDREGAERDIAAAKAINAGIAEEFARYGVEQSPRAQM